MAVEVTPLGAVHGHNEGLPTLEQKFRFVGAGASAAALDQVLSEAPLTGEGSIFGRRPGAESPSDSAMRVLRGFSPVVGFRFDVEMVRLGPGRFRVRFSQSDRSRPYLDGDLLWTLRDESGGVTFDEQVNTEAALAVVERPLTGPARSLRRWLFFRIGHGRVMTGATQNMASLLSSID